MASVVINTRFNNRKAEADLKELQAKAKETAREINAVEKGLGSATTKRNKLRDDLEAARQKAAETAAALDEVNARLDAGRKSKFSAIMSTNLLSGNLPVPNVSMRTEVGEATPIA